MGEAKHTPGPWRAAKNEPAGEYAYRIASDRAGEIVAEVMDGPTTEADARLIAAAPELLAALEDITFEFSRVAGNLIPPTDDSEWARIEHSLQTARAAIRKATTGA